MAGRRESSGGEEAWELYPASAAYQEKRGTGERERENGRMGNEMRLGTIRLTALQQPDTAIPPRFRAQRERVLRILARWEASDPVRNRQFLFVLPNGMGNEAAQRRGNGTTGSVATLVGGYPFARHSLGAATL